MALNMTGSKLELLRNTLFIIFMEEHITTIRYHRRYTQIAQNRRTSHCQYQTATNCILTYNYKLHTYV